MSICIAYRRYLLGSLAGGGAAVFIVGANFLPYVRLPTLFDIHKWFVLLLLLLLYSAVIFAVPAIVTAAAGLILIPRWERSSSLDVKRLLTFPKECEQRSRSWAVGFSYLF
jgi:hypothetical protein